MLTARGRRTIAIGLIAGLAGRIFGVPELFGLATAAVVVTVVALGQVRLSRAKPLVTAHAVPPVVAAGDQALLELRVEVSGAGGTLSNSIVLLADGTQPPGLRLPAKLLVAHLGRGEFAESVFEIPTQKRGVIDLGAYTAAVADPLGLAIRNVSSSAPASCVVLPRLEPLPAAVPAGLCWPGADGTLSAAERFVSGSSMLRRYVPGDDLRRVHWSTTARVGELMVREGGDSADDGKVATTVLLDAGGPQVQADELDRAVEVAASVLAAAAEDSGGGAYRPYRVVTTTGLDSGPICGPAGLQSALVSLAGVGQAPDLAGERFWATVGRLGSPEHDTLLVVVGAFGSSGPDPTLLFELAPGYSGIVVVHVGADATGDISAVGSRREPYAAVDSVTGLTEIGRWSSGSRLGTLERRVLTVPLALGDSLADAWALELGGEPGGGEVERCRDDIGDGQ